jgi:hypothetical protein
MNTNKFLCQPFQPFNVGKCLMEFLWDDDDSFKSDDLTLSFSHFQKDEVIYGVSKCFQRNVFCQLKSFYGGRKAFWDENILIENEDGKH